MHVHDAGAAGHGLAPHDRRLLWQDLTSMRIPRLVRHERR